MRVILALIMAFLVSIGALQAKPVRVFDDPKVEPKDAKAPLFKPVEINNELNANDGNDPQLQQPAKTYTVKLHKDKTYVIDMISKDFDAYLRLLDKNGTQLAEDDDSGGDLDARIVHTPKETGDHQIAAITLDGQLGKFQLKVREITIHGEAKPRELGKDGLSVTDQIRQNDKSALGKLGKTFTVAVKAGQSYIIDLESATLDSYLYVFDAQSKLLAQDDDSGDEVNSRIVLRAENDGVVHILATSLGGDETGEFTLRVRKKE